MTEKIIKMTRQNLEQCINLYIEVFNSKPWLENWEYNTAQERLSDLFNTPKFKGYILFRDHKAVGFIAGHSKKSCQETTFYLAELCVSNEFQGKGYGSKLLMHLEEEIKKDNVKSLYLLTLNKGLAQAFYRKNHFNENQDRIVMKKPI